MSKRTVLVLLAGELDMLLLPAPSISDELALTPTSYSPQLLMLCEPRPQFERTQSRLHFQSASQHAVITTGGTSGTVGSMHLCAPMVQLIEALLVVLLTR